MSKRKLLLAALAVSAVGVMPLPAAAAVDIFVDIAPPAPRYEVVPAPRAGYVWQPGVWDRERWADNRYEGRRAYGDRDRDGVPNRYDRDRDGDGVPNRYDAAPDNPRRQ